MTRRVICVCASLALLGCGSRGVNNPVQSRTAWSGRTMGTTYSITIAHVRLNDQQRAELKTQVDAKLAELNRQMSTYDPESEISRFNRSAETTPFAVSAAVVTVVAEAQRLAKESQGRLDVTVGPLVDLWGFGSQGRRTKPPSDAEIKATIDSIGFDHLQVAHNPPTLTKRIPTLHVDLSAIAKGYGVDQISELLTEEGFHDHMVEIGGEVVARGVNPSGKPWKIGIERPADNAADARDPEYIVTLTDKGLATSGNYRNYFVSNGRRYSHTLDPRTGRPVDHNLASVSVVAPSCMRADGIATAVLVMGPEDGLKWLESLPDVEGLMLVKEDGRWRIIVTQGMKAVLARRHKRGI